ncbi:MAG TPA: PBP1A family penicillin-binding protein [Stellaceae bacterium]
MMRTLRALARVAFFAIVIGVVVLGGAAAVTLFYFNRELPSHKQLADYIPATGTKVYAADSSLMLELETEHRIPVPLAKIPPLLIHAVLAAEDRDFYSHKGVNPIAIFRAAVADIGRYQKGQRPMGASTITQQVVRHFLLTNEVSIVRKIKEMLLAYRIENELSKDRILEIYLNEIYFGAGAYGVAAAADTYFQKPLDKLTLAEAAFIAALPKAPNNYNAARHAKAAQARRDWVLSSMAEVGWISQDQAKAAIAEPLGVHIREPEGTQNGYFAEEVRRELIARFGEKAVYEGGMTVHTSYMPNHQKLAEAAFRNGLVEYDRRHGWRGALAHLPNPQAAVAALPGMPDPSGIPSWKLAAVTSVEAGGARVTLRDGSTGTVALQDMLWARRALDDQRLGGAVHRIQDVVQPGDIVLVEGVRSTVAASAAPVKARYVRQQPQPTETRYLLRQIPDVSGGVVVMDPKTGRVYALVGGWSFQQSQFDRATQAKRQPGSAFKPFVYVTALQNGFTPSSVVDDAPIELPQGPGQPPWRPANYEGTYAGPSTLEDALVHSRNLVTARLATMIGLPAIAKTVQDFDIMDRMPLYYSMVLGAGETTLLRLTSAYAMLDNGGHWLLPSVVDLVQDRDGKVVYQKGIKACAACFVAAAPAAAAAPNALYVVSGSPDPSWITVPNARYVENAVLYKPTKPDTLVNPDADTEITAMMQGVVQRGTGTVVASVGKPLAGKTGTTSDWFDAWFVGFSPDLVAGVYVGFDEPRTLGGGEVGGRVAAPIFRDFMAAALKDVPPKEFPPPPAGSMPGAGTPMAALVNGSPDETPWESGRPSVDDVTVLDGRTASRDAGPPDWNQPPGAAAAAYAAPAAPDYRIPKSRAAAPWQNPAYAAAPSPDTTQMPPDSATAPDRTYRRQQNPAYAAAPADYARQPPADDAGSSDRRYDRPQPPAFAAVPRAYAAPAPAYTAPRLPAYPPYGVSGYGGGMPGYGAPAYGSGYSYGYPAGSYGPRPGTGGLY